MEQGNPIYSFMKDNGLTSKDEATFVKEYSTPEKARELHTFMQENGLTQKDYDSFYGEYFTPKGAASEGQPATSGNASSGPIKPYRGSYKREEARPVSPVTIAPKQPKERVGGLIIGEESEIPQKVQKELKRQVAAEEVLQEGAPSVEGYYGELTADQKRAAQNYDPLKQAQDAVEYDNLKVATKDWATSKGISEVSKAISEGRTREAFATAQDDYLESISDPNKRNSERAKIEELRAKPVEQLTQTDKDYLREINDKAINAYAAMEKVKIRDLMGDADVQAYTDIASNLNTQFASVNKRLNDLKNSNLSQEEKRVRSMELEATAQRLQEKYNALIQETGVTQEQLALLNESYRNLQYINNADEANKLAFGAAERAVIDKEIKQRRKDEGPVADFMNSLTNTVVSGLLSTAQVPKVLGDMVGDEDYDAFDKVYDSLAASKATLSKEMGRKEGFEKLPLYAQIPTMLGEGIGSVALLAGGGAALGGGSLGVTAAAFLTMEADMYEEMKNLGLSPQEAAKYATITSTLLGAVETIVPDAEYFDAKLASRSVIAAMRKGATNKEAINLALKEVLPSAMEYISRTGLSGVKEAGEESVGAISEGLLKNSINAIEGREVFKGSLNLDNVAEQALMGFVTGGALAAAGRMVASRRSEVQESALNALADNPTVFEAALENDPTLESERSVVDEAAKIRAAWKAIPSFNNLNENVQNHIVSEALRVKQLTKAAKDAMADPRVIASEVNDAKSNILYAQNNNKIKGDKSETAPVSDLKKEAASTTGEAVKQGEDITKNRDLDLFPEVNEFSSIVGDSKSNSKISNYKEINGIGFSEYSNSETGDLDLVVTGTSDHDFVGFIRIYENGKPTNRWTSKFENQSGNKENFKTMISEAQKMLPKGHEYTEKTSISTDGLRVFAQQLNKGYELQYDDNGNVITNAVAINGDSKVNDLGINVTPGDFSNISVTNDADFEKVKKALKPYLENLGLSEKDIFWRSGTVKINLPVLKQKADDSQNEQGVPSEVGGGQAAVETQPIEGTGAAQVGPSGNVQALEEEVVAPKTAEAPMAAEQAAVGEAKQEEFFYHGTPAGKIESFDESKIGSTTDEGGIGDYGKGFYFGPSEEAVSKYATGEKANVVKVKLDMKNPLDLRKISIYDQEIIKLRKEGGYSAFDTPDEVYEKAAKKAGSTVQELEFMQETLDAMNDNWQENEISDILKEKGYDSVVSPNGERVVFDKNQIQIVSQSIEGKNTPTITPEEEAAGEQEFAAAVENVKAVEPALTEDEADHAAALVQSGESVEEAVKHVKEVAEKQAEEKAENPQNKLIHFKSLYNKLGKKDKKTKGVNLYNKIQELSKELGFSVIINPKNGDVRFLDKKGRRVAKLGVDRSANANVADLKKAVAWANQNGTPEAKALLFFVEGNSVSSNEIERYFLKNTEEVNSLIKKGLVVKSSSSNKAEIIQDVEDNPDVSAGEAKSVFKEIVDVLLTYGDKKVMTNELVDLYNKAMEVEGGQENLSDQELQERQEYYDRLEKEQEYIDAMQSIDELANEWDALPKEEQEKIINIVQYESEIDQRTESVFNEAVSEREDGGTDVTARSEKRTAKAKEDLTSFEKQRLNEISNRKQEIEGEISSIKKQKASKEREISKRIQDNSENLFGEKNNKREQELFDDEIDSSNQNLKSILGEYDNKIKSLQDEYSSLSSEENNILYSEKEKDLFAQAEEAVAPEVAAEQAEVDTQSLSPIEFSKTLELKYGVELDLMGNLEEGDITLSRIVVPKSQREKGIGKQVMQEIIDYADKNNKRIVLTPSSDFGGNVSRLKDFYKEFGFVENKGKNKDFSTKEAMYRAPKPSEAITPIPEVAVSEAEAQQATESDIFAAVDAEPTTPTERAAARRASKAKFGKEAYEKAVKITKNFNKIIESLEREGKITKQCP